MKAYPRIKITDEQIEYANSLVEYSLSNHTVKDIYHNDIGMTEQKKRTYRLTGTLGEVVFADAYNLPRPKRSFGAVDGQDNGVDFRMDISGKEYVFDIKTMARDRTMKLYEHYVHNIPYYQTKKQNVQTTHYFCITLTGENSYASLVGMFEYDKLSELGEIYDENTVRANDGGKVIIPNRKNIEVPYSKLSGVPKKQICTDYIVDYLYEYIK